MQTILSLIAAFAVILVVLLAAVAKESPAHAEQTPAAAPTLGQGEAGDLFAPMLGGPQAN